MLTRRERYDENNCFDLIRMKWMNEMNELKINLKENDICLVIYDEEERIIVIIMI